MTAQTTDIIAAHTRSSNHRKEIEASATCGCFHCLATFEPASISEWTDSPEDTPAGSANEAGTTAICPRCGVDSVIGAASGYPITREFLSAMRDFWF